MTLWKIFLGVEANVASYIMEDVKLELQFYVTPYKKEILNIFIKKVQNINKFIKLPKIQNNIDCLSCNKPRMAY